MKIKLYFILFAGIWWAFAAQAQTDDNLKGDWTLENMDVYEYFDNDSILIGTDSFVLKPITGAFTTLSFSENTVKVKLGEVFIASVYVKEKAKIRFDIMSLSFEYAILEDREQLILFRRYQDLNSEKELVFYGVKLTYLK
jgi:hypothetical protein